MNEAEHMRLNRGTNNRFCRVCCKSKNVQKFRRYNGVHARVCNECFLSRKKERVEDVRD